MGEGRGGEERGRGEEGEEEGRYRITSACMYIHTW